MDLWQVDLGVTFYDIVCKSLVKALVPLSVYRRRSQPDVLDRYVAPGSNIFSLNVAAIFTIKSAGVEPWMGTAAALAWRAAANDYCFILALYFLTR